MARATLDTSETGEHHKPSRTTTVTENSIVVTIPFERIDAERNAVGDNRPIMWGIPP